jgi:hypothetical protein
VTGEDRRLAALAAVFVPARAAETLGRLATPCAREAIALAARLAAAGRRERLDELSSALAPDDARAPSAWDPIASRERGRVAALVRAIAAGLPLPPEVSPALVRLCRERLAR